MTNRTNPGDEGAETDQAQATARTDPPPKNDGSPAPQSSFPVVGIGASAGGLDAFKRFFAAMPASNGMAFVLIPHLDPAHESLMAELLSKYTQMPVREAKDDMAIEANCVYVIPPNRYLTIGNGRLQLSVPTERRGLETAIDFCFRSLAADQGEKAIGIVLSGTGCHGTSGLKEIKLAGGMLMVQQPESAEYDQMPRNAIATGQVDYILPPEQMPDALIQYVRQPYLNHAPEAQAPPTPKPVELNPILALLRTRTQYDFRCYRKKMLMRRVQRRMGLCHIQEMSEYLAYLRENPDEVTALYKDLLIGVTHFFREPEAYRVLVQRVIPKLVERSDADVPVRVWVPGCATGEEAYSIAILLLERFAEVKDPPNIQIFATDIDEGSLESARTGIYPEGIAADVSTERVKRFFVRTREHSYQVSKQLRESVVFAPQNLISDAPFSRLDLISCRNLLIYLEPEVQTKVIRLFHFALKEDGNLLLGPSETIGRQLDLFKPISKKWRVYRRIGPVCRELVEIPISMTERQAVQMARPEQTVRPSVGFEGLMQRVVLSDFVPGAALINRRYEVLSVLGPLANYLEFPPGELTKDLLAMARQGLRTKIRAAVHKAIRDKETVTDAEARVKRNGAYFPCKITVKPLVEPKEAEDLLLVAFEERIEATAAVAAATEAGEESSVVKQLEYELKASREDLQSTIEEMESSNEELKASNEEVMSMNEELQSANEELETSKEELQSLNEELSTVNNQLQDKVDELDKANNDMTNLLASTDIATIFLDPEKRIQQFTQPTAKLLSLIAADVGRPIGDFSSRLANSALLPDVDRVLEKLTPLEKEVRTEDGECYLRRVTPYRTQDNRIEGVVVTFVDITRRTRVEKELKTLNETLELQVAERTAKLSQKEQEFHALADNVPARFCYLDADQVYRYVNRRCEVEFGQPAADIVGKRMEEVLGPQTYAIARPQIQRVLSGHEVHFQVETETVKGPQVFQVTYMPDFDEGEQVKGFFALVADVTARRQAEERVRLLSQVVEQSPVSVMVTDPDAHIQYVNAAFERVSGYRAKEVAGRNPRLLKSGNTPEITYREMWDTIVAGRTWQGEFQNRRKDGTHYWENAFLSPVVDKAGKIRHYVAVKEDITQRKEITQALYDRERRLSAIVDNAAEAIISIDREGIIQDFNPSAEHIFGYRADEAQGQHVSLLIPALDGETHDSDIRQLAPTGGEKILGKAHEVSGRRKDGSLFPVELLFTKVDHLGLFVGLLRDISERKALEQEIIEISTFEQERIGRDIHDGIGQQLTGLSMLASSLERKLEKARRPLEAEAATRLVEHLQQAVEETKTLSQGLSPVEIAPDGLVEALSNLADRTATASGIRCRLMASRPASAPNEFDAIHLYRIAQEAMNNAVKHAKADNIEIGLEDRDQDLVLWVRDDGVGIKPMKDRRGRLGLHIMQYRCDIIGGKLKIEPLAAGGTLLQCALPKNRT